MVKLYALHPIGLRLFAFLCVLSIAFAGCSRNPEGDQSTPTAESRGSEPQQNLRLESEKLTLTEAHERYENYYRPRPDGRFLGAIAEIDEIVSGEVKRNVNSEFIDGKWQINYGGGSVGSLSEIPDFQEQRKLLLDWARRRADSHRIKVSDKNGAASAVKSVVTSSKGTIAEVKDSSGGVIGVSPAHLIALATDAGRRWSRGERDGRPLKSASTALIWLNLESLDLMEVDDELSSRALATLALSDVLNVQSSEENWCLAADSLRYFRESREIAEKLAKESPVSLYVLGNLSQLEALAKKEAAPAQASLLYARAVARGGHADSWKRFVAVHLANQKGLLLPLLSTFHDIAGDDSLMPLGVAVMLGALSEVESQGEQKQRLDVGQLTWSYQNYSQSPDWLTRDLLKEFEHSLRNFKTEVRGPFLSAATVQKFYRGYFYSGVRLLFESYSALPAGRSICERFAQVLSLNEQGSARLLSEWLRERIDLRYGNATVAAVESDFVKFRDLGTPALMGAFRDFMDHSLGRDDMSSRIRLCRSLFSSVDARPLHLDALAEISDRGLSDSRLTSKFWHYSNKLGLRDVIDPQFAYLDFCLRPGEGRKALQLLMRKRRFSVHKQVQILDHLRLNALESSDLLPEYERLVKTCPDKWYAMSAFADYLIALRNYHDAATKLRSWIARQSSFHFVDEESSKAKLANALLLSGHTADGLNVLSKRNGESLDWLVAKALLLSAASNGREATIFAQAALDRYPSSARAIATRAQVEWQSGRYADAARILHSHQERLGVNDWLQGGAVSNAFINVFGDDRNKALLAVAALKDESISSADQLGSLASAAFRMGHPEVAFTILSAVPASAAQQPARLVTGYEYLRCSVGRAEALQWLKKNCAPDERNRLAPFAFEYGMSELLWDFIPDVPQGDGAEQVWLLRAAASVSSKIVSTNRLALLKQHFSGLNSIAGALGRNLLDLPDANKLFGMKLANQQLATCAFFMGWKALRRPKDFREDTSWLRVCVETCASDVQEFSWATAWLDHIERYVGGPMLARDDVVITVTLQDHPYGPADRPVPFDKVGYNFHYHLDRPENGTGPKSLIPVRHLRN